MKTRIEFQEREEGNSRCHAPAIYAKDQQYMARDGILSGPPPV